MAAMIANAARNVTNKARRTRALARAAGRLFEKLEPRQLLSASVNVYPIPIDSSSYWSAYNASIVAGPDGNYWFTEPSEAAIGRVTPSGDVKQFKLPTHMVDYGYGSYPEYTDPSSLAVGSDGNLWFTENGASRIGRITTAGVITEFDLPGQQYSYPESLTLGKDGNIWFTLSGAQSVGRITPKGVVTEFSLLSYYPSWGSHSMVQGTDGNVWFIASGDSDTALASITPQGILHFHPISSYASSLAVGPDGKFWVGEEDSIERVSPDGNTKTSFSLSDNGYQYINTIEAGNDGNLYFTLSGSLSFGRITTDGTITEFALPKATSDANSPQIQPADILQAADGKLWFIDSSSPDVGNVDLAHALLAAGNSLTVTAGTPSAQTVGSFTDLAGGGSASDYTATLTLSDNTQIDCTIAPNNSGGFDVSATSSWQMGYNTATLTVTDTRDTSRVATANVTITGTAPQPVGTGVDISAVSGETFSGKVATFTNVVLNSLDQYSATIDWGDGHISDGTITANSDGGVDITGTNAYAASGDFTITVTLSPYRWFYPLADVGVDPLPPVTATGGTVSNISTTVTPPRGAPGAPVSNLSGGTSYVSPGVPTPAGGGGTNNTSIAVDPPIWWWWGGQSGTATSKATVALGAMEGVGYSVQASTKNTFNDTVAAFSLADPNADLSHYHATVQWSDPGIKYWWFQLDMADTAGTITSDGNGGFTVTTKADFANAGLYHFTVKITDDRLTAGTDQVGVAYGQVCVDSPNVWLPVFLANDGSVTATPTAQPSGGGGGSAASLPPSGSINNSAAIDPALGQTVTASANTVKCAAGKSFSGAVATLSNLSTASISNLHGTIHWGDGSSSSAAFTTDANGKVTVQGTHTYTDNGSRNVTVDVTQDLQSSGQNTNLYPLHLPTITAAAKISGHHHAIITGGVPVIATAGTAFNGTVAAFTTTAAPTGVVRTMTIFWGDGTHTTSTLDGSITDVTITGSHTWKKAHKFKIHIQVTQKSMVKGVKVPHVLAQITTTATVS